MRRQQPEPDPETKKRVQEAAAMCRRLTRINRELLEMLEAVLPPEESEPARAPDVQRGSGDG